MTYLEIYENALWDLEHNNITLGEFEERIKPLNQEPILTDTEIDRRKAICKIADVKEIDDVSDGFHTFRQLYYQRMMLFATIVKQNKDKAWKSLKHEDGELCFGGGWFIVGIDTPEGSYTYHYEDNFYSLFDCIELDRAKHWDGHTEKDVTRLLSLEQGISEDCISRQAILDRWKNTTLRGRTEFDQVIMMMPPVIPQPKIVHCKDCKYFEYDSVAQVDGIPVIIAYEVCKKWGQGCKTDENGYCFLAELKGENNE